MKKFSQLFLSVLLAANLSCGGGSGSSGSGSYTSTVQIVLGESKTTSAEKGTILQETTDIPSSVDKIRFTISASDMETIQRIISVAGRTSITEAFEVPIGPSRRFLVESLDSAGNVIFRGEVYANIDERPVSLTISVVSTDPIAPIFSGLSAVSRISSTSLSLSWSAATDNVTPQSKIQYLGYAATASGGEDFSSPSFTTSAGATSHTVTGLNPGAIYYFVVRAKDEAGNVDANTVERSERTQFIDLFINNVATSPTLSFDVNNSGNVDANNVVIYALYSDFCGQTCQSVTVTVPAGGTVSVTSLPIPTSTVSTYKIIADPNQVISPEPDKSNNEVCSGALCTSPTPTTCP